MFFYGFWSIWGADFKSDECLIVNVEHFPDNHFRFGVTPLTTEDP